MPMLYMIVGVCGEGDLVGLVHAMTKQRTRLQSLKSPTPCIWPPVCTECRAVFFTAVTLKKCLNAPPNGCPPVFHAPPLAPSGKTGFLAIWQPWTQRHQHMIYTPLNINTHTSTQTHQSNYGESIIIVKV